MKLTEAKLKQMILETMQRSSNYEKLRDSMVTHEGYIQAESLYEMTREAFEEAEQMHLDIFFKPLIVARERKKIAEKFKEAYDNYNTQRQIFYNGRITAGEEEILNELYSQMHLIQNQLGNKTVELEDSYDILNSHVQKYPSEASENLPKIVSDALWVIATGFPRPESR